MTKAVWQGAVLAQSDDTVVVEGNHYFPRESVDWSLLKENGKTTVCGWKGTANYYDIEVNGKTNSGGAWYYSEPKAAAAQIRGRIAFWQGVEVK